MPGSRAIVFLTDFGLDSEWVGICHAVIARVAPDARVIDLSHFVEPLGVEAGARLLSDSMRYLPDDAIVLAVVDPNVGADRDIAVEANDSRIFVGPDNGLLSSAWDAAGGVARAVEITSTEVIVEPVAPSFHARDILGPAAAHLAAGVPLDALGDAIEPGSLARLEIRLPQVEPGKIRCEVIDANRFGNVQLNVRDSDLAEGGLHDSPRLSVESLTGWVEVRRAGTYADFERGEYGLIFDPRGWLTIIRGNPGNALQDLHLSIGDMLWITQTAAEGQAASS